jgi:importin subunit alpha-1
MKCALPVLCSLIHMQDDNVLVNACWALPYLSVGSNVKIQALIDVGIFLKLVELLW